MSAHGHDIQKEVRKYIIVFVALMILTLVTVVISRFHLPTGQAITLALVVATIKATLVAGFFMHLFSETVTINVLLVSVVSLFLCLLILPVGNAQDHLYGTQDTSKQYLIEQMASDNPDNEHTDSHVDNGH